MSEPEQEEKDPEERREEGVRIRRWWSSKLNAPRRHTGPAMVLGLVSGSPYDPGSSRLGWHREAARLQWIRESGGGETCSPDSATAAGAPHPQVWV